MFLVFPTFLLPPIITYCLRSPVTTVYPLPTNTYAYRLFLPLLPAVLSGTILMATYLPYLFTYGYFTYTEWHYTYGCLLTLFTLVALYLWLIYLY